MNSSIVLATALLATALSFAARAAEPPRTYRIVGYVTGRAKIEHIDAARLTHINYAFAQVSKSGEIVLEDKDAPAHLERIMSLKAKNPNLKIILSVGGWGADHFSDAALTDDSRERFARSGLDIIARHNLDGIDLDWEYPGQAGPGIKFRPEDKQNFTLMLKCMREHLDSLSDERGRRGDQRYLLTIASADRAYFDHTEMDKLHVYLDFINIMAYDFYNSLTRVASHHAGLYRSEGAGERTRFGQASVNQHLAAGIPAQKLVLGVPFYGRGFAGVKADPPMNQPYEKYAGDYSFAELTEKYINKNGFERRWDDQAKAPYLWNAQSKTMISYDDEQSLQEKTRFVREQGLGGIMYWEQSHDPDGILLGAVYKGLHGG